MTSPRHLVAVAALCAAAAVAAADGPAERASPDGRAAVLDLLARLPADDAAARFDVVDRLSRLPWRDLADALADPGEDDPGERRRAALRDALHFGGETTAEQMLRAAGAADAPAHVRVVALELAARPASTATASAVLAAGRGAEVREQSSLSFSRSFGDALTACLRRQPGDLRAVVAQWRELSPRLRTLVLDVVEAVGVHGGDRALAALATFADPDDEDLFERLASAPFRRPVPVDAIAESAVVRALEGRNAIVRASAAVVLGRLGGPEHAERLRALLTAEDRCVAQAAHRALQAATGVRLVADADLWKLRLDEERAWLETQAPALLERLGGEPKDVVDALAVLSDHRVHAAALLPRVLDVLRSADPDVRAAACKALGRMAQPRAIPALLGQLEDAKTANAASAALAEITRLKPPKTLAGWREALTADAF